MAIQCEICGNRYEPKASLQWQCPTCMLLATLPEIADTVQRGSGSSGHTAFEPPDIAELTPHFREFEILELAGRGGMSAVYKARQKNLDRFVALKILPVEVANAGGIERFRREAKALAQLTHKNIVTIYNFGEAGPWVYFLMEYVDGCNLRHVIGGGDLGSDEIIRIVLDVCEALQFAHDHGVVHRDIKPENILLDRNDGVKLVDFGLAKMVASTESIRVTGTGQVMGTPHYLAPEQLRSCKSVDRRADLYSLGVVLYELLTGELPIGNFDMPSVRSQRDDRWDAIVRRALSSEPNRRYSEARELRRDVSSVEEVQLSNTDECLPTSNAKRDSAWVAALCSLLLLGISFYFFDRGTKLMRPDINLKTHFEWGLHEFTRGGICLLLAVVVARVNLDSPSARSPSISQRLIGFVVSLGYGLLTTIVAFLPAFFVLLFAAFPVISGTSNHTNWELWDIFYRERDGESIFTPYWYQAMGIGAVLSSIWSLMLFGASRLIAKLDRAKLEPLGQWGVRVFGWVILFVGIFVLLPLGGILLYAADKYR